MTRQEKETLETNFETTKEQLDEVKHAVENFKENSESIELLESKIQLQLEEIEAQDKFINCLKDKNKLLENHAAENLQEAENFQIQISKMQENLHDLESALFEQTSHNAGKKILFCTLFCPYFVQKIKIRKFDKKYFKFLVFLSKHSSTDKETDVSWDIFIIWKINSGLVWSKKVWAENKFKVFF